MVTYCKNIVLFGIKLGLILKKEFDSEPVYNKRILKTKIKSFGDEAPDFHDKYISKAGYDYTCLAVITNESALKKDKNYYLQVFLEECKYIEKEVIRNITGNQEISSRVKKLVV